MNNIEIDRKIAETEDVYVLKSKVRGLALNALNFSSYQPVEKILKAVAEQHHMPTIGQLKDWIAAIESEKRIVNPLSPEEEFRNKYIKTYDANWANKQYREGYSDGMLDCLKIVAKEHKDVADWLKAGDENA